MSCLNLENQIIYQNSYSLTTTDCNMFRWQRQSTIDGSLNSNDNMQIDHNHKPKRPMERMLTLERKDLLFF
jgi:hypothetical protein